MTFHIAAVSVHPAPGVGVGASHWLRLGATQELCDLASLQVNGLLLLLPQWVTAINLALALIGFAGWTSTWGHRATLVAMIYLALFAIIGQPENQYWGALLAPLLCLGVAQSPAALTALCKSAFRMTSERSLTPAVSV